MGDSSGEESDDLCDSQHNEYKQLSYKLFQFRTYRLRCSNGDFGCPFCDLNEKRENHYIHLFLHAIKVAEASKSGKHGANHFAMARYLAIDLHHEVKAEADRLSKGETDAADNVLRLERELDAKTQEINNLITSNDELLGARAELMTSEKLALDKVCKLERRINEMSNEMNARITKERSSIDELERVHRVVVVRETEAAARILQLERELNEKTEKMNDIITSNDELQGARRESLKREKQALDKVCKLERRINEMSDEMNALITKERSSSDELQRVRRELNVEKVVKDMTKEMEDSRLRFTTKHGCCEHALLAQLPVDVEKGWAQRVTKPVSPDLEDIIVNISHRNLLAVERIKNAELQGARRELIKWLNGWKNHKNSGIGIKQMGEIDVNVFEKVCTKRFPAKEAEVKTLALHNKWQEKLKTPQWYPFHMVEVEEGKFKKEVKEDDEALRRLKQKWGDEACSAVVTALEDMLRYSPSRSHTVPKLWNFEENREAKLEEVISYVFTELEGKKRKKSKS